jgi:osmotically-inducible protein OsmY
MSRSSLFVLRRTALIGGAALALGHLSGCVGLALTGAAVGTMAAIDRRTLGAQTEDQSIELKAAGRLRDALGSASGISVISYNRKVLIVGFVASENVKRQAEEAVRRVENVQTVHNELQIGMRPSLSTAASDAALTARVKAAHVDAKDIQANAFKVVSESGVVYLMGVVTQREGDRAAQVASRVSGVQRVVTVFEYVSEDELARIERRTR